MHLIRRLFRWPRRCAGAIQTALPDVVCPGLLRKPLDAGIGRLFAPYCPSGCQGNRQTNNNQQMHLKWWPNWWPWQCAGTESPTSPNGRGLGLCKMPLNTTIGRVLQPIEGNETKNTGYFWVFISSTRWKGAQGDIKVPDNNRGMTYQSDGKELSKRMWYLVGYSELVK